MMQPQMVLLFWFSKCDTLWQLNDAEGLDGKFKIELTKVKRNYMAVRESPKFEPTNIVSLVNMVFKEGFRNQKMP
jgi:hypothetical protein